MGCHTKLASMSRAQRALLPVAANKILACARCRCVQAVTWANFAADWLQTCVGIHNVCDTLRVGAFACGS